MYDPMHMHLLIQLCGVFKEIYRLQHFQFDYSWFRHADLGMMTNTVKVLQQNLTFNLLEDQEEYELFIPVLDYLFKGNLLRHPKNRVDFKEFNNDVINKEKEKEVQEHFIKWFKEKNGIIDDEDNFIAAFLGQQKKEKKSEIMLVDYPWIFDANAKSRLMQIESRISQRDEQMDMINEMGGHVSRASLYLLVRVERENLIESALNNLINSGSSLRKPLKVVFEGEPGVDEGGVQKEFF